MKTRPPGGVSAAVSGLGSGLGPRLGLGLCLFVAGVSTSLGAAAASDDPPPASDDVTADIEPSADEPSEREGAVRCSFVPAPGRVNPLGLRAFVSVHRDGEDAVFLYERLPRPLGVDGASIAVERRLRLVGRDLADARAWLLAHPEHFAALTGGEPGVPYARVDATLGCD